jgi:predicted porin
VPLWHSAATFVTAEGIFMNRFVVGFALLSVFYMESDAKAAEFPNGDGSLTWCGITLSGIVDLGIANQTHGAPLSSAYYTGLEYVISKNSNRSVTTIAPSGLSQSRIVLSGLEPVADGWSVVFKLETDFNPQSGQIANSSKALVENAGVPLDQQNTNADGNKNGQIFGGSAYGGIASNTYGTLTFGRQTSTLSDSIAAYDPQGASYAFSVLGYSGFIAGGGDTQDVRLDDTIKYKVNYGLFRAAALYQFPGSDGYSGGTQQALLGLDYGSFSADIVYSRVKDAVTVSGLTAVQLANPAIPASSLAATISDNTAYAAMARYAFRQVTVLAGYEHITYANPSDPLSNGFTDEGGYQVIALLTNNTAYGNERKLDIFWTGLRYSVTPEATVSAGYYHIFQNSFRGDGCVTTAFAQCSGYENAVSLVLDYRLSKRWDVYLGSMYTGVSGGMASGFLHDSTIGTMSGVRFTF